MPPQFVLPLGLNIPVVGFNVSDPYGTFDDNLLGKKLAIARFGNNYEYTSVFDADNYQISMANKYTIGLGINLSNATGAKAIVCIKY